MLGILVGIALTAGAVMTETGRITGLIAGYVLLVQILSMSRVGWLEQRVGGKLEFTTHQGHDFPADVSQDSGFLAADGPVDHIAVPDGDGGGVPEPAMLGLLGTAGLLAMKRSRKPE